LRPAGRHAASDSRSRCEHSNVDPGIWRESMDQVRSARCGDGRLSGNARRSMERGYPSRSVTAVGFAGASKASTESAFIV
jgi:hypothetical protein